MVCFLGTEAVCTEGEIFMQRVEHCEDSSTLPSHPKELELSMQRLEDWTA